MTIDLEQRLTDGLSARARSVNPRPTDLAAVTARGQRLKTRQRAALGAGVAVVALVLGLAGINLVQRDTTTIRVDQVAD